MNNKKGVSAVIATVLIILITLAAAAILWQFVLPMITTQMDQGKVCSSVTSAIAVSPDYSCSNSTTTKIQIKNSPVIGNINYNLSKIKIIISINGNSNSTEETSVPGVGEEKVYDCSDTQKDASAASVVAYVNLGKSKIIECPASPAVLLTKC